MRRLSPASTKIFRTMIPLVLRFFEEKLLRKEIIVTRTSGLVPQVYQQTSKIKISLRVAQILHQPYLNLRIKNKWDAFFTSVYIETDRCTSCGRNTVTQMQL